MSYLLVAMKAKDPELFGKVSHLPTHQVVDAWRAVYPEDLPQGVITSLDDAKAIVPKPKDA